MRSRVTKLILVGAVVASLSGMAAPANASTCQTAVLDKVICDTVVEPAMAALCKAKICFG